MTEKEEVYARRFDHTKKVREKVTKKAVEEHKENQPDTPKTIRYKLSRENEFDKKK